MSLPIPWVQRIFAKLTLLYGRDFLGRWEGQDIEAVMADWAHELAGFERNPEAIKHALSHLPAAKPPTVLEFRDLCRGAPSTTKALPAPAVKADPEMAAKVAQAISRNDPVHPRHWAELLRRRELACERLTVAQRAMWREALGAKAVDEASEVAA